MTQLFTINTNIFLFVLTAFILVLIVWIVVLELRLNRLLRGSDNKSLEGSIRHLQKQTEDFLKFKKEIEEYLKNVEVRLRQSIRGTKTIRFNPFKGTGTGGNQSFATAFMNESGDGVVISTMHTRDRVGVFSKPIKNGTSEYELTEEEHSAVKEASKSLLG